MSSAARVVFDCNTLLQGLASPQGSAGRCVQLAMDGKLMLFVSPEVLEELRKVAARPRVRRKLKISADRVDEFLEAIQVAATLLSGFPVVFSYKRDPDDAVYVNLALAANATLIVTRDNDLLDLMNASIPDGRDFQQRFPRLKIVTPVEMLQRVQSEK